jgi:hypothetical protein
LTVHRCLVVEHGKRWRDDNDDNGDHEEDYSEALAYHNEDAKDDSDDYVACIFQEWQLAMAKGRKFEYSDNMTHDVIVRRRHS